MVAAITGKNFVKATTICGKSSVLAAAIIRRLPWKGLQVVERARPLPTSAKLDNISYTNHGGVGIVAPNNIQVDVLPPVLSPSTFKHLRTRSTSRGASCVVLLVYRSGSQAVSPQFFTELTKILEHLSTLALPVVLTGDVDIILDRPDDSSCQRFTELVTSFDLLQHVDQPTHDLGGSPDVVVTRSDRPHPVIEVVDVGISDHRLMKWTLDVESSLPVYETSSRRSWRGFDVDTFRSALRESNLCDINYVA